MWRPWRNQIFYEIRKRLPSLNRSPYSEEPCLDFEQDTIRTSWAKSLNSENLRLSHFYLEILESLEFKSKSEKARVMDIGSKDFSYAAGLAEFLDSKFSSFELTALELDPYQIYFDFHTRGDAAEYHVYSIRENLRSESSVQYLQGDWLLWEPDENFDLITCFFPFLYDDLHDRFGLPRKAFDPRAFYSKCMRSSDAVIFFHQGEEELRDSKKLIESLGLMSIVQERRFTSRAYLPRKSAVYALLLQRESAQMTERSTPFEKIFEAVLENSDKT